MLLIQLINFHCSINVSHSQLDVTLSIENNEMKREKLYVNVKLLQLLRQLIKHVHFNSIKQVSFNSQGERRKKCQHYEARIIKSSSSRKTMQFITHLMNTVESESCVRLTLSSLSIYCSSVMWGCILRLNSIIHTNVSLRDEPLAHTTRSIAYICL